MKTLFLLIAIAYSPVVAWAASGADTDHLISTAGGISAPSFSSAIEENPAGLVYTDHLHVLGAAESSNSNFSPLGYEGLLLAGNKTAAGGIGVSNSAGSGTPTVIFGAATQLSSAGLSLGIAGGYKSGSTLGLNLGLIWTLKSAARIGLEAFDIVGGVNGYGTGIAIDPTNNSTLAVDLSSDSSFRNKVLKPGITFHTKEFQLSAGYGIEVDTNGSSFIRSGGSLGLGIRLTNAIHLEGYYNQIAKYFVGLLFRI